MRPGFLASCLLSPVLFMLSAAQAADTVSFADQILPMLEAQCGGCHMTGDEPGGLALIADMARPSLLKASSQQNALPIVAPGDPERSYLILKLEDRHLEAGGQGVRMPFGAPPLDDAFISQLRNWISQGAPDN